MPSIGPSLPPPSKRSHEDADDSSTQDDSSDKRRRIVGPAPPPTRSIGPSMPPDIARDSSSPESGPAPAPARVLGAAPPPAPLEERPLAPADDDSDSSDDEFGPAPPPVGAQASSFDDAVPEKSMSAFDTDPQFTEPAKNAQRDEWMTLPPTQDDLAARMDPTKQRARKFNSGKSASSAGGMSSAWTETPEQKLKRLQDEAMGISTPAHSGSGAELRSHKSREEERRERKMREKIESSRGKSLVEQHQEKGTGKEKEDDPSKRTFDYEKDMAVSGSVNHKQRREMLSKSKGFGDRFSSGSFL